MLTKCPRCSSAIGPEHDQPDGVTQCSRCRHLFHAREGFPWHWVIIWLIFAMGVVKTLTNPTESVSAAEGWYLRHRN